MHPFTTRALRASEGPLITQLEDDTCGGAAAALYCDRKNKQE